MRRSESVPSPPSDGRSREKAWPLVDGYAAETISDSRYLSAHLAGHWLRDADSSADRNLSWLCSLTATEPLFGIGGCGPPQPPIANARAQMSRAFLVPGLG